MQVNSSDVAVNRHNAESQKKRKYCCGRINVTPHAHTLSKKKGKYFKYS